MTQEQLDSAIDDLFNPYPDFNTGSVLAIDQLKEKNKETIEQNIYNFHTLHDGVYEDIHDDISNCGRNPLAKFIEQIQLLAIIKHDTPQEYQTIMQYLTKEINS